MGKRMGNRMGIRIEMTLTMRETGEGNQRYVLTLALTHIKPDPALFDDPQLSQS